VADRETNVLAKLIVANARMQSKIYKILSPDQQKKLKDLELVGASLAFTQQNTWTKPSPVMLTWKWC
jgi:hypothetical protein